MALSSRKVLVAVLVLVVCVFAVVRARHDRAYELNVLMPSADGAIKGSAVTIGGERVGTVSSVGVSSNAARLGLRLDGRRMPLHAGTVARITWNSLIGRRQVELLPGPTSNPVLRSGQLVKTSVERVELDDLLGMLDAPTRANVQKLVANLDAALAGNQQDLQQTLQDLGPFVAALGEVMNGVGADQPAIDHLATRLHRLTGTLSARNADTADTVRQLTAAVTATATQADELAAALAELPGTAQDATRFFGHVPGAVDAAVPLLEKLQPTTRQLPGVARQLNPVLTDLRPAVADLKPTLAAAGDLLRQTPGLLDVGTQTLPGVDSALRTLQPAVSFLRPYTPEVVGFLTNWTSLFSAKNRSGHYGRALVPVSATMVNSNPGILPPGMTQWKAPLPGQLADQPWTDANGDAAR